MTVLEAPDPVREMMLDAPPALEPAAQPPRAVWRWLERIAAVIVAIGLFYGCLWLYTQHNDFTLGYHADEWTKAEQLLSERRNFNHPLLMLEATEWALKQWPAGENPQAIVETGRWVSAAMGAGAAVALAWVGYASGGLLGMLIVGAAVGLCPQLLLYSHYMKEDVALVFGLALTLLGSRAAWDAQRWWTRLPALLLLGAGAGLAASGKYVGVIALGLVLVTALLAPRMRWHWRLVAPLFAAWCAVGTFLLINHRVLDPNDFYHFLVGHEREFEHATSHHTGLRLDVPNTFFVGLLTEETMPHARVLAGVLVVCAVGTVLRRFKRLWDVLAVLFAGGYLLALSYSVIPFHRYFLPVSVMVYLLAGLGAVALLNLFGRRGPLRWAAAAIALTVIVALQGPRCADYLNQLADDSRARLREWITANVPRGAVILAEDYARLRGPGDHRPGQDFPTPGHVRIRTLSAGPDAGPLDRLARYTDYVVIADTRYERYFAPVHREDGNDAELQRMRDWYRGLDAYEKVWSVEPAHPTHSFTNPTIKVYRLKQHAATRHQPDAPPSVTRWGC